MAREPALSEFTRAQLCGLVAAGCSRRAAAGMLGVHESTVRYYLNRDPEFAKQVRDAEARRLLIPLNHLRNAAATQWRAAAWFLERTCPGDYARRPGDKINGETLDKFAEWLIETVKKRVINDQERHAWAKDAEALQDRIDRVLSPWAPVPPDNDCLPYEHDAGSHDAGGKDEPPTRTTVEEF